MHEGTSPRANFASGITNPNPFRGGKLPPYLAFSAVPPPGLEPCSSAPEADALSTELRGRSEQNFTIGRRKLSAKEKGW